MLHTILHGSLVPFYTLKCLAVCQNHNIIDRSLAVCHRLSPSVGSSLRFRFAALPFTISTVYPPCY